MTPEQFGTFIAQTTAARLAQQLQQTLPPMVGTVLDGRLFEAVKIALQQPETVTRINDEGQEYKENVSRAQLMAENNDLLKDLISAQEELVEQNSKVFKLLRKRRRRARDEP